MCSAQATPSRSWGLETPAAPTPTSYMGAGSVNPRTRGWVDSKGEIIVTACSSPCPFRDLLRAASAWKVSDYLTYLCPHTQCCTPGFAGYPFLGVSDSGWSPAPPSLPPTRRKDGGIRVPLVSGFLIWICQHPGRWGVGGHVGGCRTGSTKDSGRLGLKKKKKLCLGTGAG